METTIHPDVKTYYGRYWAASMEASAPDGPVSLIFLWNEDDADRLAENMIGHALQQRRSKSPLTVFFATTDVDSEYYLSVHNDTGEVLLELPGRKPVRTVASCLEEFIDALAPNPPPPR